MRSVNSRIGIYTELIFPYSGILAYRYTKKKFVREAEKFAVAHSGLRPATDFRRKFFHTYVYKKRKRKNI